MKEFFWNLAQSLLVLFILAAFFGFIYQDRIWRPENPIVRTSDAPRTFNSHWQDTQDAKLVACYQEMPTQEEVNRCLLELGVFI